MTEDDDDEPLKPASEPVTGGQAEGAFGWTGLVPVVGHGLVFNWVRLEAPAKCNDINFIHVVRQF